MLKKFLVVGLFLLASSNAWALSFQAGDTVKMLKDSVAPYSLEASDGTIYSTFCLESEKHFTPGSSYIVKSIGDYADGGGGGAVNGLDQVSTETKWLYAAYMSDVFSNVRDADNKVQTAIWYLEDEKGGSESAWNALKEYTFDATGWTVVAVNITLNGIDDNQSQLLGEKTAPVPEPATLFLLGSGLIGLIGNRRKKN